MAHVKAQGTQVFAVVDGAVVRFTCPKAFSFGDDSFSKIDSTCLDSDTKDYERGLRDPGEGSIQIDLDDTNTNYYNNKTNKPALDTIKIPSNCLSYINLFI